MTPIPGLLFMPVVDGGLLSSTPEDQVASGSASDIPLLIGTTRDESSFFTVGESGSELAGRSRVCGGGCGALTPDPELADDLITRIRTVRSVPR